MAGTTETTRVAGIPSGYPSQLDADVQVRFVDDALQVLSNFEAPILKTVGGINAFSYNASKVEWVEDDLWNRRANLDNNPLAAGGTTLSLDGNIAHRFPVGSVIQIEDEKVLVTAVADADDLTVIRGYAGTTDAEHASGTEVTLVGNAFDENDAWQLRTSSIFSAPYNLTQIFQGKYRATYRRMETNIYGLVGNDLDYHVGKGLKELMVALEGSVINGTRFAGSGGTEPSMMGGILYYMDTSVDANANVTDLNGAALTEKHLNDLLQTIFYKVGKTKMATTVLCGAWVKRKISSWYSGTLRMRQEENKAGIVVDKLETDFGVIDIMGPILSIPKNELILINPDYIKVGHHGQLGRFHTEEVETDGPYKDKAIYGEYSVMVKNLGAMGRIKEISTTS